MARMHSRDKGKAGSNKPVKKAVPSWTRHEGKEVEMLVAKLGKEVKSAAKVGLMLRDSYGIPNVKVATGKTVTEILAEKKLLPEIPDDLMDLIKKSIMIMSHIEENNQDKVAKRGLKLTESKIRRLVKYYKGTKRLSADWKYDPSKVKLLLD